MSNIDKQDTREKFEAWAEQAGAFPWGHLKKQRNASGNYSVQVYTYMWHAWSACHESLLDELEAAESGVAELNDALCKLLPGCQYMDPPDGGSVTPLEQVTRMVADYRERMEAAERELSLCKSILENIKSTSCHVDTSKGAFIPNSLDAWGRPVPQYLPYDFSGNPGASATQYCNGWNDAGGYWLNHVKCLQECIADAGIRINGEG